MDEKTGAQWVLIETREHILQTGETLTLREYHEALDACIDLGLDKTWRFFKHSLEQAIERAKEQAKLGIPKF